MQEFSGLDEIEIKGTRRGRRTVGVTNMNAGAHIAFAVSKHAIINIIMSRKRNAFDDRGGDD